MSGTRQTSQLVPKPDLTDPAYQIDIEKPGVRVSHLTAECCCANDDRLPSLAQRIAQYRTG
jgi:hypothetical protein